MPSSRNIPKRSCRMVVSGLCGTGMGRSAVSRPGSARSMCAARRCGIARPIRRPTRRCGSPPTSCRNGRGARRASMPCCRCFTCAAFRPAISRRRWARSWGADAPNLSPSVISRLTGEWQQDYDRWQRRDLSARRYVYIWADGVYLQARMEPQAECMLVILGATPEGKKELVGFQVGIRESAPELARAAGRHQGARPRGAAGDRRR